MVEANVLIAGSVWPRWPYEVLQHARRGDFVLVLCPLLIRQARLRIEARFSRHTAAFEGALQA